MWIFGRCEGAALLAGFENVTQGVGTSRKWQYALKRIQRNAEQRPRRRSRTGPAVSGDDFKPRYYRAFKRNKGNDSFARLKVSVPVSGNVKLDMPEGQRLIRLEDTDE